MTDKEKLEQLAYDEGVPVDYIDFTGDRLYGLYIDGSIAIKKGMDINKTADVLAEEIGHYHTTVGRIIEQDSVNARKQERAARLWGYNKRIGLMGIINAYKAHCHNSFEVAEYLGVSEESLLAALELYRQIYGRGEMIDNYFVQFEPYLMVHEFHRIG